MLRQTGYDGREHRFAYKLAGACVTHVDTNGTNLAADTTEYQYDAATRLTKIIYKGAGSKNEVTSYTWDNDSRLTQKILPNGITVSYQYDLASRLKQIEYTNSSNAVVDRIHYSYDANGQIIKRESLNAISRQETPYTAIYNAANRLTQITLNLGMADQANYTLTYDANGNLTEKRNSNVPSDVTTYQWNSENRLTSLNAPGILASFQYDGLGRRIGKTVNGHTTTYLYDGLQAIGEIQPTANGTNIHINLTGLNLDEAIARYTQIVNSNTVTGEKSNTYLTDLLGSVIAQAKADQGIESRYAYSAYGEVSVQGNDNHNAIQYTARENDNTGLYFYRARYYDPVLNRFISSDPIGLEGGMNAYAYVHGSPLLYADPLGLFRMYGNWGGQNWSGGESGPRIPNIPKPPKDSLDECFRDHDYCYQQNEDGLCGNPKAGEKACDEELLQCMSKLPRDSKDWDRPPLPDWRDYGNNFRKAATLYFARKW